MKAIFAVFVMVAVSLAGCADKAAPPTNLDDLDEDDLKAGKGAIAGLLVDDRFRPIAAAKILVQESGDEVTTNENGEFLIVDLEPRTYTLRVTAPGHEASPKQVRVEEGLFAEAEILARRISTQDNVIVTEEHVGFIPCAFANPVILITLNCVFDLSGDTFRSSVTVNYAETYGDNITFLVAEVLINNEGNYAFPLRDSGTACPCYGRQNIDAGTWGKVILQNNDEAAYDGSSTPWNASKRLNVGVFGRGEVDTPGGNFGAYTGIKMRFMISLFLSEPEVDLEEYSLYN